MPPSVRANITKPTESTRGYPNFSRPVIAFYNVTTTSVPSPFCSSLLTDAFRLYPFQPFSRRPATLLDILTGDPVRVVHFATIEILNRGHKYYYLPD